MRPLLSTLLPMSLAAGVSPMMLSEQLVLVSGRDGQRTGKAFAAGTATVLLVLIALVLTIGGSLALPRAPTLSASLDVTLGVLLLAVAAFVRFRPTRPKRAPEPARPRGVGNAYGFGVFSMATNLTTLPLVVAGAKDVAASGVPVLGVAVAVALLLSGGCLPTWTPLVLERFPSGKRLLEGVSNGLERHGRMLVVTVLAGAGLMFVAKGCLAM